MTTLHLPNVPLDTATVHHSLLRDGRDGLVVSGADVCAPHGPSVPRVVDGIGPRGGRAGVAEAEERVGAEFCGCGCGEGGGDVGVEGGGGWGTVTVPEGSWVGLLVGLRMVKEGFGEFEDWSGDGRASMLIQAPKVPPISCCRLSPSLATNATINTSPMIPPFFPAFSRSTLLKPFAAALPGRPP
jgi:hypothetical protein